MRGKFEIVEQPEGKPESISITTEEIKNESGFDSFTKEEQEIELERALYIIQTAEEHEIPLNARDVALILGYENDESLISKISNLIKEKLPLIKGREEKFKAVVGHIQEKALFENQEFDESKRFSEWIEQFNPTELAGARLVSASVSDAMMEIPIITITKQDGTTATFELSNLLNLTKEQLTKLPEYIQKDLEARREFWEMYVMTSGPELKNFLEQNFFHEDIQFSENESLAEIEWLKTVYPEDYAFLENLKKQGSEIRLVTCRQSPDNVLGAVRHIATESQHKFVSTWLPDMIREGTRPVVLRKDIEVLEKQYSDRLKIVQEIQNQAEFRKQLVAKLFREELTQKTDFLRSIEQIEGFTPFYISIEVSGGNISPEDILRIREINQKFDSGIGNEYAKRKLLFDDANEISEEAQNIIKAMAIVGPAAHVLEHSFHLPGIAKFLAASTDDIMSEWAEISALRGAGISWKEIRSRFKTLAPAIPIAFALAGVVEPARQMLNERLAGAIFSSAAVFLSAVTCTLSAKMFAEKYGELAKEGKLREFYPVISEEELEKIKSATETLNVEVTPEKIWSAIEDSLRRLGEDEGSIQEKRELFFRFVQSKDAEEILKGLEQPSFLKRYKEGTKEAMGINPARFGIAMGAFTSPVFGFLAGPTFLARPLLYALAGSYESAAGVGSIIGYKKIFPLLWRHHVREEIRKKIKESKEQ